MADGVNIGDSVAIDDISFEDCDFDPDLPCEFICGNSVCIPDSMRCDYSDDCGDNSEEMSCGEFQRLQDFLV